MRKTAGKGNPGLQLCQVCSSESCASKQVSPQSMDMPREEVQLTRDSAAGITVSPIGWLVAVAALRGTGVSPLLAAQAAAAPRQTRGVGAPQHPPPALAGLPDGCCGDTTERCCWGTEKWVLLRASPFPARHPQEEDQYPLLVLYYPKTAVVISVL